jgi:hypothetical protein
VSEIERLMSILREVFDRPEAREEFQIEVYKLHRKDPALFEQTMVDFEKLAPQLHREIVDFVKNVVEVREFLAKVE